MDAREAAEKARKILEDNGADRALIKLFCEVRYYAAWQKNHSNFDSERNFGVKNVHSETHGINSRQWRDREVEFVAGEIEGLPFAIGGDRHSFSPPEGDPIAWLTVYLFLRGNLTVHVDYMEADMDCMLPDDYHLATVKEFHSSPELFEMLKRSSVMIDAYRAARERKRIEEENEKARGKFTF